MILPVTCNHTSRSAFNHNTHTYTIYPHSPMSQAASGGGGRPMGKPMRSGEGNIPFSKMVFDGKRMRKAIQRRTVDYNHSLTRWMQVRISHSTRSIVLVNNKETCMSMNVSITTENMLNSISFFFLSLCVALVCSLSLSLSCLAHVP